MRKVPQKLFDNLEQQERAHQSLLGLLVRESAMRPSFNTGSLGDLEELQKQKYDLLKLLQSLDSDRESIIGELQKDWNSPDINNISGMLALVSQTEAGRLRKHRNSLTTAIQQINQFTRQTGEISKARLNAFRQISDNFNGIVPSSNTYAHSGKIKSQTRPRIISHSV